MKKFYFVFFVILSALCICSCSPKKLSPLNDEAQTKIKSDYAELYNKSGDGKITADDVVIENYFGTYDNAVALRITSKHEGYFFVMVYKTIAGMDFEFNSTQPLYIYKDGNFTPIDEAYDNGIISEKDVKNIHYYFENEKNKETK